MNKIRVIDLLNIKFCGNELPKQIKYNQKIFTKKGNGISDDVYYCSDDDDYEISHYIDFYKLNDEIEIIEEPKEELEELEEMEYAKAGDLMITIINKLIENQNKIIRELKANK